MHRRASKPPTFLVTGSNGQIGFELRRSLAPLGRVLAFDRAACDLTDTDRLRAMIRDVRPDVIVNAAAYTAVDRAESESDLAFAINGAAPGVLAEEAQTLGTLLIHYSTDYVFSGTAEVPYVETDCAGPLSVYGRSKLAGEQAIAATGAQAIVLRTCWVAGAHGANFAKTILRLARERDSLRVIADQFGAPTTASLIADVTAHIVDRAWLCGEHTSCPAGVFHLAAAGETSWHGYATEIVRHAIGRGANLRLGPNDIEAIPAIDFPLPAPRPGNSRLDTGKLRETFDIHLPEWQQAVQYLLDQIIS